GLFVDGTGRKADRTRNVEIRERSCGARVDHDESWLLAREVGMHVRGIGFERELGGEVPVRDLGRCGGDFRDEAERRTLGHGGSSQESETAWRCSDPATAPAPRPFSSRGPDHYRNGPAHV